MRVLIIDDDAGFRRHARIALEADGRFRVVGESPNGAEGVELARDCMPDLVLMDVKMPVMGGVEATRRITAEMPDVAVVLVTGFAEVATDDVGAAGLMTKDDFTPARLLEMLGSE